MLRRYPVVYALHGYSIGAEQWSEEIHVPQTIEGAFAQGAHEMIVVLPDSKTAHNGSMYSSSVTTGDFEQFVAHDVVAYIDAHYRTIPDRTSRGLVGHSMGGYGATRIGMKHAGRVRQPLHHEPVLPVARATRPANPEIEKALAAVKTPADSASLPFLAARAARHAPRPGHPTRKIRRSISTCRRRTANRSRRSSRSGPRMRRSLSSTNTSATSGSTAQSRSMWATRTACESTPRKLHEFSISTESRTASRSIPARTPAGSPIASRIM